MLISKNAQSGFTMVEMLVAVVILAVGLLGLAQLQITAIKANSQSATMMVASSLAQKIIEDIAAINDDDTLFTTAVTDATWPGSPFTAGEEDELSGGTYDVTYTVDIGTGSGYKGVTKLCLIKVKVKSTSNLMNVTGNKKREVNVSTIRRAV